MIKSLRLKFGPDGLDGEPLVVKAGAMTVFVGPNNSGKSLLLREIQLFAEQGPRAGRMILDGLEVGLPRSGDVSPTLKPLRSAPPSGTTLAEGVRRYSRTIPGRGATQVDVNVEQISQQVRSLEEQEAGGREDVWWRAPNALFTHLVSLFTVALDGRTRLALTDEQNAGDLLGPPTNHLHALFVDDEARGRVRALTKEAFGLYFVIDPTHSGKLRIRMSECEPEENAEEQSYDRRARDFHKAAKPVSELSDGVKAFTGLTAAVISSGFRVMIVDEAEAFLHPPLARMLGREMTALAASRKGSVFASTHSPHFLIGCVESGKPVNVVRLTYDAPRATARVLPSAELRTLMRDPLLRSAGVLGALFHPGAIVCEGDSDRAFYEEINRRLDESGRTAARDSVFLNAQNKDTLHKIVGPLRSMGIPVAAVADLDVLKGNTLRELLQACHVPAAIRQSIGQLRGQVERNLRALGDLKQAGIESLSGPEKAEATELLNQLRSYGIFVVPGGELESWLKSLDVDAAKKNWLQAVFDALGADPDSANYVAPQAGDVWTFVEEIGHWIKDSNRKGMPLMVEEGITDEESGAEVEEGTEAPSPLKE